MNFPAVSHSELVKKSREMIYSSRLLLHGLYETLPTHNKPLEEIDVRPKLIIFLPTSCVATISEQILQSKVLNKIDMTLCLSWKEFSTALLKNPDLILFHINLVPLPTTSLTEFINTMETLIKCMPGCTNTKLALGITKNTNISIIKTAKKSSIIGLCPAPSDFGIIELDKAISKLIKIEPYWPENIIGQMAGAVTKSAKQQEFALTFKQNEVLDLICFRGLSNKAIARIMGISESTVKIHVGAILKAYGLRNRTQLALAASDSLRA